MATQQKSFSSNLGAIMAAVGSAVGLGNIWRFPYICGQYGGGAFLIVYLCFVFLLGAVLMMSEFVIGRRSQHRTLQAYGVVAKGKKGWNVIGVLGLITCFFILSQYLVLSGWTTSYIWDAVDGTLASLGTDAGAISDHFSSFSVSTWRPVLCLSIFAVLVLVVVLGGVQSGIESVSKLLMPLLVLLVLVLCVRSLTLPNAGRGVEYLFMPDFSRLTGQGILAALGQALFSLSVGMGAMIVYGSYIPVKDNLFSTAMWITACDTLIAVLSGLAIFPAVFSCGFDPTGGPGLVFCVLPNVFNMMGGAGVVFAAIFFILLMVAALTSAISLLETLAASCSERFNWKRLNSSMALFVLTTAAGVVFSLSLGRLSHIKIADLTLFDLVDKLNSIYLPPLTALATIIFLGWVVPDADVRDELSNHGTIKIGYYPVFRFLVRFVVPVALTVVLITGIKG
ncbi:MAG: sodium-dependent transporter [Bacteroidales bacterium]|nr:sodium-dependent transporter [Bacteroidales bacterium]